ncbi:C26 family cysteine hydrolase domain-containing family [Micromonospora sp. HSS6-12]|uniref:CTP synthase (glutamine hydrolyzing) n=1 Tax=Micromonospora thermarum TaxID=2720024 RepID=A0ABX0Z5Z3_9ACTN|nr:C26 family cysteine hydrolase domain-containing family [Micromonospora thermarum]
MFEGQQHVFGRVARMNGCEALAGKVAHQTETNEMCHSALHFRSRESQFRRGVLDLLVTQHIFVNLVQVFVLATALVHRSFLFGFAPFCTRCSLPDAYLSVTEAIRAGGIAASARVRIRWVTSEDCATPAGAEAQLADVDGICIPGGFGERGVPGKIETVRFARENGVPLLGLCLGLQCVVMEAARNLLGLAGANSTEFDPETPFPVVSTMAEQVGIVGGGGDLGGTMRLGTYPAVLAEGSVVRDAYGGAAEVSERHRHRYEVNNAYRDELQAKAGLVISGTSPDGSLIEFVEYPNDVHPYLVATQAHPEFRSRPTRPHPLFAGLLRAAVRRAQSEHTDERF